MDKLTDKIATREQVKAAYNNAIFVLLNDIITSKSQPEKAHHLALAYEALTKSPFRYRTMAEDMEKSGLVSKAGKMRPIKKSVGKIYVAKNKSSGQYWTKSDGWSHTKQPRTYNRKCDIGNSLNRLWKGSFDVVEMDMVEA